MPKKNQHKSFFKLYAHWDIGISNVHLETESCDAIKKKVMDATKNNSPDKHVNCQYKLSGLDGTSPNPKFHAFGNNGADASVLRLISYENGNPTKYTPWMISATRKSVSTSITEERSYLPPLSLTQIIMKIIIIPYGISNELAAAILPLVDRYGSNSPLPVDSV